MLSIGRCPANGLETARPVIHALPAGIQVDRKRSPVGQVWVEGQEAGLVDKRVAQVGKVKGIHENGLGGG